MKRLFYSIFLSYVVTLLGFQAHAADSIAATNERPLLLLVTAEKRAVNASWTASIDENFRGASKALGVKYEHLFAGNVHPTVLSRLEERLRKKPQPDYMIFTNQRGLGMDLLKLGESYGVKTFLYNAPLVDSEYEELGGPRSKFKYWIGELMPDDDERVGYDLAHFLIKEAKKKKAARNDTKHVRFVSITGRTTETSSINRSAGLMRALGEYDDVELLQSVSGRWLSDISAKKYEGLLGRYGTIDVVWAANDHMALGVLSVMGHGYDAPYVGSVDWLPDAISELSKDRLVITYGRHAFDIAYVVALLNEYHKGNDFMKHSGTASLKSRLSFLTKDNASDFADFSDLKKNGLIDYEAGFSGLVRPDGLENINMQRFISQSMTKSMANMDREHG